MEHFQLLHDGARLLAVGELDMAAEPVLRAALATVNGQAVNLDLTAVTFIDSKGLRVLFGLREEHPGVRIADVSPAVRRLLDLTGVGDRLFTAGGSPGRATT